MCPCQNNSEFCVIHPDKCDCYYFTLHGHIRLKTGTWPEHILVTAPSTGNNMWQASEERCPYEIKLDQLKEKTLEMKF